MSIADFEALRQSARTESFSGEDTSWLGEDEVE